MKEIGSVQKEFGFRCKTGVFVAASVRSGFCLSVAGFGWRERQKRDSWWTPRSRGCASVGECDKQFGVGVSLT